MRNFFIISLLSLYVSISTHLIELIKLPMLYHHYVEHKQEEHTLNFFSFIVQHYTANQDNLDGEHKHLPFKSMKEIGNFGIVILHDIFCINTTSLPEIVFRDIVNHYKTRYSYHHLSTIWQPPRA